MKLNKCNIQNNGDKTKTSSRSKNVAELGRSITNSKQRGTNVKLLVAILGFINRVYPKNAKLAKCVFA